MSEKLASKNPSIKNRFEWKRQITDKYLTRTLLIKTKWIHGLSDEEKEILTNEQIEKKTRMPIHVFSYCRMCEAQHSHQRIAYDQKGAWYRCVKCYWEPE